MAKICIGDITESTFLNTSGLVETESSATFVHGITDLGWNHAGLITAEEFSTAAVNATPGFYDGNYFYSLQTSGTNITNLYATVDVSDYGPGHLEFKTLDATTGTSSGDIVISILVESFSTGSVGSDMRTTAGPLESSGSVSFTYPASTIADALQINTVSTNINLTGDEQFMMIRLNYHHPNVNFTLTDQLYSLGLYMNFVSS